jgi:hypothetical protein
MLAAVIPVRNEKQRVGKLLLRLLHIEHISSIFVILNGSDRSTLEEVESIYRQNQLKLVLVNFSSALGIDVPRAVGAYLAYTAGMSHVLFMDGDMVGEITAEINSFIRNSMAEQIDLGLVNCYPGREDEINSNETMLYFRRLLNEKLSLADPLGSASPSHGPHIVSRKLLETAPWKDFAIPPSLLVHAKTHNLNIGVTGHIPHARLGSSIKNQAHSDLIVDTVAGDCLEALCLWQNLPRSRYYNGRFYNGYHPQRRFDLLDSFLAGS